MWAMQVYESESDEVKRSNLSAQSDDDERVAD